MTGIHFIRPEAAWGFAALLLIPLLVRSGGQRGGVWRKICDPELLEALLVRTGGKRKVMPLLLLSAGWILTVIALTGPAFEKMPQPTFSKGRDTVYLLDVSPLSGVRDVKPDRLTRARFKLFDLLKKNAGGQSALILYGETPFTAVPLTPDPKMIETILPTVQTGLIGNGAPDLGAALLSAKALLRQTGSVGGRAVVLGAYADETARDAAAELHKSGYSVSVLGIGTNEGTPVTLPDGRFMTKDGRVVLSALPRRMMEKVAAAGNGVYSDLSVGEDDVAALSASSNGGRRDDNGPDATVKVDEWKDCGYWLVFPVLLFALFGFGKGRLFVFALTLLTSEADAKWYDFWKRADVVEAEKISRGEAPSDDFVFQDPSWRAVAEYRQKKFDNAAKILEPSSSAEDKYNYGNALAQSGRLQDAVNAYADVLKAVPDHADAAYNKKYVEDLLKKQQKQNQQRNQQQDERQKQQQDRQQDQQPQNQQRDQQAQNQQAQNQQQNADNQNGREKKEKNTGTGAEPQERQAAADKKNDEQKQQNDRSFVPEKDKDRKDGREGQMQTAAEQSKEDREKQEQKQWLSIIEDDPAGLLRERIRRYNLRKRGVR